MSFSALCCSRISRIIFFLLASSRNRLCLTLSRSRFFCSRMASLMTPFCWTTSFCRSRPLSRRFRSSSRCLSFAFFSFPCLFSSLPFSCSLCLRICLPFSCLFSFSCSVFCFTLSSPSSNSTFLWRTFCFLSSSSFRSSSLFHLLNSPESRSPVSSSLSFLRLSSSAFATTLASFSTAAFVFLVSFVKSSLSWIFASTLRSLFRKLPISNCSGPFSSALRLLGALCFALIPLFSSSTVFFA